MQNAPQVNTKIIIQYCAIIYALKLCKKIGNSTFCMNFGHFIIRKKSLNLLPPDVACNASAKLGPGVEIRRTTNIYTRSAPLSLNNVFPNTARFLVNFVKNISASAV